MEGTANLRDLNALGLIVSGSVIEIIDLRNKRTESMSVAGIGIKKGVGKMIEDQKDQIAKEVRSEKEKDQKDLAAVTEEKTDQKVDQNPPVLVRLINTRKVKKKRKKKVKKLK